MISPLQHSNLPKALHLFLDSKPRQVSISTSLAMGHLLVHVLANQPTKLLEPFLTSQVATLNPESLPSEPISTDYILSPTTLCSFHHHPTPFTIIPTQSSQISVRINWKPMQFFWSVEHLLMGHTLHLTLWGLLGHESNYRSKSREGWWGWILRRISRHAEPCLL